YLGPNYFVVLVLESGVVLVLLGVEVVLGPVAAGLLFSQPTVNANNPQRTSKVQIFFIALTFPKNCARNILRRDRPAPSHYLKRPPGANIFPPRLKNIEITRPLLNACDQRFYLRQGHGCGREFAVRQSEGRNGSR